MNVIMIPRDNDTIIRAASIQSRSIIIVFA